MRIAAVDFETTDLKAMMGVLLCGTFQPIIGEYHYPKPTTFQLKQDARNPYDPDPDKVLAVQLRDEIDKYNLIVTWNGKLFDIPFLNSRLMFHGERPCRPQFHLDLMYYMAGTSNRVGGRKLQVAQQFLHLPQTKTSLEWEVWKRAEKGDKIAMAQVVKHCEVDTLITAKAYWPLLPYVARLHR